MGGKGKNGDLKSKRRGGFYWNESLPYLTVTEILKIVDKPALRYWFGKEVFRAMVKNPYLSEKEALAEPYKQTKKAINRGLAVHKAVENYKNTKKYAAGIPKKYKGYAEAFYEFFNHYKAKILLSEKTVFSNNYGYAGTLDLLLALNGDKLPYVVDIKTGKNIYEEAFLQSAAYQNGLLENGTETQGIAVLLLHKNGDYTFEIRKNTIEYFEGFIAAKRLYEVLHRDKLIRFGYLEEGGE